MSYKSPTILITFILLLIFSAASCGPQSKITSTIPAVPPTMLPLTGPVPRLAWFYKPPANQTIDLLTSSFDVFILTKQDEDFRDRLQQAGVSTPFLQYLRAEAIMAKEDCTDQPYRNQVADRPGDFCELITQHPNWFLRDQNGEIINANSNYRPMDPANPEWQAFFLERTRQSQETLGWDGVFLDNVDASLGRWRDRDQLPATYSTDAEYRQAVQSFLAFLYTSYFQPNGRPLYANITATQDYADWQMYMPYLDGVMQEAFAVDWRSGYRPVDEWLAQLALAESVQAQGKHIILVSQGAPNDLDRQTFAYASYLLIANGDASFRYAHHDSYNQLWWYTSYEIRLGTPTSARYFDGENWRRDFTNGYVLVNPTTHYAQIETTP